MAPTAKYPVEVGNAVLIGPRTALFGCTIEDEVFLATGTRVFHLAVVRKRAEVRVNAVVHLKTVVPQEATVPIGWIAVGDPARILSPDQHDAIWAIQKPRALTGANGMSRVRQRSCASSAVGMCPRPGDTFGKRSRHPIGGTGGDHRSQPGPSL